MKSKVEYQYEKLAYHFNRLRGYGESSDAILQKMLMSQAQPSEPIEEPKNEEPKTVKLVGYLKYPKVWSGKEHQSMFVVGNDTHSSIQLFFPLTGDKIEDNNYLIRLANMESQKIQVLIEAFEIGFTSTGKKNMSVVSIVDYKEYKKMKKNELTHKKRTI